MDVGETIIFFLYGILHIAPLNMATHLAFWQISLAFQEQR